MERKGLVTILGDLTDRETPPSNDTQSVKYCRRCSESGPGQLRENHGFCLFVCFYFNPWEGFLEEVVVDLDLGRLALLQWLV